MQVRSGERWPVGVESFGWGATGAKTLAVLERARVTRRMIRCDEREIITKPPLIASLQHRHNEAGSAQQDGARVRI